MRQCKTTWDTAALSSTLTTLKKTLPDRWITYTCELVTPMYGGGVEAGKIDESMPIRASSIRGQLRFWWRIANGPFDDAQDMFQQEAAIWGGIGDGEEKSSKVEVRVGATHRKQSDHLMSSRNFYYPNAEDGRKYAIGSAGIKGDVNFLNKGFKFDLMVRCAPEVTQTVETALRWWATFGGIGGRTRRGFGAVLVDGIESISEDEIKKLEHSKGDAQLVVNPAPFDNAEDAWKLATGKLFNFRQGVGVGRQGKSKPSRSYWPEPDQLRRITKKDKNGAHPAVHKAGNVFPRAAFGLPITFDFNDKTKTEPQTLVLKPQDYERLASPLIIRPVRSGKQWQAAALLLPGWQGALEEAIEFSDDIRKHFKPPRLWPTDSTQRQEVVQHIPPMNKDGNPRADNPLSAFLDFFKETVSKGKK